MKIIVLADEDFKEDFISKEISADVEVIYINNLSWITTKANFNSADAFFILKEINIEDNKAFGGKPVFINSVTPTLKELNLPENFSRINGWPTFVKRKVWEIASSNENAARKIFENLHFKYINVADEPGLVSARIISMIINEAYFALGENVSSKEEIDLAMKLGTNYPYGPFEWCKKIGLKKVHSLLEKLNETDSRYTIAPAMKNELTTAQ
jgi:3-hydroxybutyryl-CoA dehydrogenase